MDLFNKAKEIALKSLSIWYNANPMTLVNCVPPPLGKLEQQGPNVEKL
jgi:hypothetical protein